MSLVFDYSFFLQGLCSMFTPLWSLLSLLFLSNVPLQGVCSSCSAFAVTSAMETCVQRAASSEGLDSTIVEFSNSSMLNFITLNSHILRFLRRSSSRDEPTKLARLCFQQVWTSQSKNLAIHKGALIELIMKEVVYRLLIDCLTAISWLAVMEGGPIGISNGCRVTFVWML